MALKRTVIEAGMGGLRISREKLPNHSGSAAERRKAARANEPRVFREYTHVYTGTTLDVSKLPPEAQKWFTNEHWPLEILPLDSPEIIEQAAANFQAAKDGVLYAAQVVRINQAWSESRPPIRHKIPLVTITFVDAEVIH